MAQLKNPALDVRSARPMIFTLGLIFLCWAWVFYIEPMIFSNKKGVAIWVSNIGAKDIIILEGVGP
jgi:hypothetical protein